VLLDTDNPDRFAPGAVLYARSERQGIVGPHPGERVRLTIDGIRGGDEFPIVAFADVADRTAAEALRGYVLEVRAEDLPDLVDGEYYPFELIGLTVVDDSGVRLGKVSDIAETPAYSLLVIQLGDEEGGGFRKKEVLIPFVLDAVPEVDLSAGSLTVKAGFVHDQTD
jgi:16S rRNA processing protein RimM